MVSNECEIETSERSEVATEYVWKQRNLLEEESRRASTTKSPAKRVEVNDEKARRMEGAYETSDTKTEVRWVCKRCETKFEWIDG